MFGCKCKTWKAFHINIYNKGQVNVDNYSLDHTNLDHTNLAIAFSKPLQKTALKNLNKPRRRYARADLEMLEKGGGHGPES